VERRERAGEVSRLGLGYHSEVSAAPIDLTKIRIVLVEPLYGGNVGQVARAMKNFGLARLVLVNPREHRTAEAYWMARDGKEIVDAAEVHPTLEAALEGVGLAVGTTRRVGKYRRPALLPEEFVEQVIPITQQNAVALVFGREDSGLSAAELALCQWIVTIPASEEFPSLNLAQAVLLLSYMLFRRSEEAWEFDAETAALTLAGPTELERLYEHLEKTLDEIGFLTGDHAPAILISLRRIFGRAMLEERDVRILRGVLGQMDWYRENSVGPLLRKDRPRAPRPAPTPRPPRSPQASSAPARDTAARTDEND
jgi:tRNA/rRNA methyltransferase